MRSVARHLRDWGSAVRAQFRNRHWVFALEVLPLVCSIARGAPQGPGELSAEFSQTLRQDILKFWIDHDIDRQYGGIIGWLDRKGNPIPPGTKSLVQQSRVVWTFAASYRRFPEPAYREVATHALKFLREKMWDAKHGGVYWAGEPDRWKRPHERRGRTATF